MSNHSNDTWSADLYSKYEAERNRPIYDLLNRIQNKTVTTAADVGCGPGNSTELLKQKFPNAKIIGMDNSTNMVEAARRRLPEVKFDVADITTWENQGPFDVILSNAVLQWVPDHAIILPALLNRLNPGGTLAIQVPDNFAEPTHRLMRQVAANGPWADKLTAAPKRLDRQSPDWYFSLLHGTVQSVDIWRTTYFHPIRTGAAGIVEMVKSTGLRPYLDALEANEQQAFIEEYQQQVAKEYPTQPDGTVLLPYPRLFIVAVR